MVFDQVRKIVGYRAPEEFIARIKAEASSHSSALVVDCVRAYHSGVRACLPSELVVASLAVGRLQSALTSSQRTLSLAAPA